MALEKREHPKRVQTAPLTGFRTQGIPKDTPLIRERSGRFLAETKPTSGRPDGLINWPLFRAHQPFGLVMREGGSGHLGMSHQYRFYSTLWHLHTMYFPTIFDLCGVHGIFHYHFCIGIVCVRACARVFVCGVIKVLNWA